MSSRTLRHIASILLLVTYLPTVMLSSVHVHHDTVDTHEDCLQCVGHIDHHHHHHQHDCPYCNFISLQYVGLPMSQSDAILPTAERVFCSGTLRVPACDLGVAMLRAPPQA